MPRTSRLVLALAVFALSALPAARAEGPARSPRAYTIEQFLTTEGVRGASFSADETRLLFSSNRTGIWNEGHGFSKKKNQIEGYGKVLVFLDQRLRGAPAKLPSPASAPGG